MEFSDDQLAAYDAAKDILARTGVDLSSGAISPPRDGEGTETAAIMGKAGSGKTVLLARLAQEMGAAGLDIISADYEPSRRSGKRSFAVLAPTNKAASVLRAQGVQHFTQFNTRVRIKAGGRFIENQQFRIMDERTAEAGALFHAFGQAAQGAVHHVVEMGEISWQSQITKNR